MKPAESTPSIAKKPEMAGLSAVREKLEEIARGEGRFSTDPLTYAENVIDGMRDLAREALALMESEQGEQMRRDHEAMERARAYVASNTADAILGTPTESGENDE